VRHLVEILYTSEFSENLLRETQKLPAMGVVLYIIHPG